MKFIKNKDIVIFCAGFLFGDIALLTMFLTALMLRHPSRTTDFLVGPLWLITVYPVAYIFNFIELICPRQVCSQGLIFISLALVAEGLLYGIFFCLVYKFYTLAKKLFQS